MTCLLADWLAGRFIINYATPVAADQCDDVMFILEYTYKTIFTRIYQPLL
jgi:hypothetical protein